MRRVEKNGTMFQMLQMLQQENMMLKASMGMPVQQAPGGAPQQSQPSGNAPAKVPQAEAQNGIAQQNRIADKAKAKAQAATQPG